MNYLEKQRNMFLAFFIFILCLSSLILLPNKSEALVTSITNSGQVSMGSVALPNNQVVIRPQPDSTDFLKSFVSATTGKPIFTAYEQSRIYVKNSTYYYLNVGTYQGRKLSYKITMLKGPLSSTQNGFFNITMHSDGTLTATDFRMSNKDYRYFFKGELIYQDTKEVVPNVLVAMPIRAQSVVYNNNNTSYSTAVDKTSLFNLIYLQNALGLSTSGSYSIQVSGDPTVVDLPFDEGDGIGLVPPRYSTSLNALTYQTETFPIVYNDREPKYSTGTLYGQSAPPDNSFFSPTARTPFTPYYLQPTLSDNSITDDIGIDISIFENLYTVYDNFYPDMFTITIKDDSKVFSKLNSTSLKISDKNNTDWTSKVSIVSADQNTLKIILSKQQMKTLGSNTLNIKYTGSNYNSSNLEKTYTAKTNQYDMPFTVSTSWKDYDNIARDSGDNKKKIIQSGGPFGTVNSTEKNVIVGDSTTNLDANYFVKDAKSILAGDTVYATFDSFKVFDTAGTFDVPITLRSTKDPNRTKKFVGKVKVTDKLVTAADLKNQSWLINEINKQLAPKKIGTSVYRSDLLKITAINTNSVTGTFANQYIPQNIQWLANLQQLVIGNKKLAGKIPATIGNLKKLKELNLSTNLVNGSIPKEIGEMESLEKLLLSGNKLEGSIPEELSKLTKLKELNLSTNQISGGIPTFIGKMASLESIWLRENKLVGQIPEFRSNLVMLDVRSNQITYNSENAPDFLPAYFAYTFIEESNTNRLILDGNAEVGILPDQKTIKPFDSEDRGYIKLHAKNMRNGDLTELYADHTFEIVNTDTKKVLYSGSASKNVEIPVEVGDKIQVIMDGANKNKNSCFDVSIKLGISHVNVKFKDEANVDLTESPIEIEGIVGTTIDLTKDEQVQKAITEIENKHYSLVKGPENETAVPIVSEDTEVVYEFKGTLYLESVPESLSFGSVSLISSHVAVEKPTYKDPLIVKDIRKDKTPWKLSVTITQPLTSIVDSKNILYKAIRYKKNDGTMVNLSKDESQIVDQGAISTSGEYDITNEWEKNNSGLVLNVFKNEILLRGDYQAKLLWQVSETP